MRINPFTAVHPHSNHAAQVACVPYDVINTAEARELARGLPHSFLHVIRSELDLPENTNPYDDRVYAKARENLQRFISEGVLVRDPPAQRNMFLYRQVMNHRAQVGLVCCCHIDDYASDVIKKHEKTRKDKEDDRTRHVLELNAHAEPVFLAYRDVETINELVEIDMNDRPLFHFVANDGVTHTIWAAHHAQKYVKAFARVPVAYIADGHHRSASAARAGMERRAANPKHSGDEEYNWFLAVLFPASQLTIMPYNRVVKDLSGLTPAQFLDALKHVGLLSPAGIPSPQSSGQVCVYLDRRWHLLEIGGPGIQPGRAAHGQNARATDDPIASLDVSLLEERVLRPILGIQDVRTDKRIDFVGGIRGTAELERRVNSGEMAVAFSMFPTTMEQLMAVSDAGAIMPPKSTWFEPKLRSGLLVHMMD
jgi:uncharacterized protein (DUF1015 family)